MRRRDPSTEPYEVTQFVSEVGTRVRLMRLARGLTQAELAERADISRLTLMSIEAGSHALCNHEGTGDSVHADTARSMRSKDTH